MTSLRNREVVINTTNINRIMEKIGQTKSFSNIITHSFNSQSRTEQVIDLLKIELNKIIGSEFKLGNIWARLLDLKKICIKSIALGINLGAKLNLKKDKKNKLNKLTIAANAYKDFINNFLYNIFDKFSNKIANLLDGYDLDITNLTKFLQNQTELIDILKKYEIFQFPTHLNTKKNLLDSKLNILIYLISKLRKNSLNKNAKYIKIKTELSDTIIELGKLIYADAKNPRQNNPDLKAVEDLKAELLKLINLYKYNIINNQQTNTNTNKKIKNLENKYKNLSSKNSGQANFGQANFGQANFGQANSGQANFGQANFGQANFGQANSGQANFG
jgi:hypothetical protein